MVESEARLESVAVGDRDGESGLVREKLGVLDSVKEVEDERVKSVGPAETVLENSAEVEEERVEVTVLERVMLEDGVKVLTKLSVRMALEPVMTGENEDVGAAEVDGMR